MKRALGWLALCAGLLLLVACSKGDSQEGGPLPQGERDAYDQLAEAFERTTSLSAGAIQAKTVRKQTSRDQGGLADDVYETGEVHRIHFEKAGSGYRYVQVSQGEESYQLPLGYAQADGVNTFYRYLAHEDGTHQWKESAAQWAQEDLPAEARPLFDLPPYEGLAAFEAEAVGKETVYRLSLGPRLLAEEAADSLYEHYALNSVQLTYRVSEGNRLIQAIREEEASWVTGGRYQVEGEGTTDAILLEGPGDMAMDFFQTDGSYIRPVYDDITDIGRETFINLPETFLFDVRVPRVSDRLPNAHRINRRIEEDFHFELTADQGDLEREGAGGDYPWLETDFEVLRFGTVYQVLIFRRSASAWGSGIAESVNKYYYDIEAQDMIYEEDFLEHMHYTPQEIEEAFRQAYFPGGEDEEIFTYEDIQDWFYFDKDGRLQFTFAMYS